MAEKTSFFQKLKNGLKKTRLNVVSGMESLFIFMFSKRNMSINLLMLPEYQLESSVLPKVERIAVADYGPLRRYVVNVRHHA